MRLLFSSIHCLLDPSSGAAIATSELLDLLASRGAECRAFTAGVLDHEDETSLDQVLATLGLPSPRFVADLGGGRAAEVVDVEAGSVRCTILATRSSRAERSPDREESASFLELASQTLERFRPDALLTYGGHPAGLGRGARGERRGARRKGCEASPPIPSPHRGGGLGRGGDRVRHTSTHLREASPPTTLLVGRPWPARGTIPDTACGTLAEASEVVRRGSKGQIDHVGY